MRARLARLVVAGMLAALDGCGGGGASGSPGVSDTVVADAAGAGDMAIVAGGDSRR